MKTMRMFLATVLALAMAAGLCGSSLAEGSGMSTTPITVWVHPYLGAERATENSDMFQEFARQFTEETGVEVDVQVIPWANRDQKMLMAFSANKGPDVVYLITDHLAQFGIMGVLEPLDDYLTDEVKADFIESTLNATTVDGKIYGIPMLLTTNPVAWNMDLVAEIGWDKELPTTWEELEAIFELAKSKGKYGFLYQGGENGNLSFYPWLWQAGGNVLDEAGNVVFDSDATRKAMTTLTNWYNKGYIPKDCLNIVGGNQINPLWESGSVLMCVGDGGTLGNYLNGSLPLNFEMKIALPFKDAVQAGFGTVGAWSVATTSKNKEAAAAFIMKMTEPENMRTFLEKSKYMPPRQSLSGMYSGDPNMQVMVDSIPYLRPGIVHPAGRNITTNIIPPMIQAVMMGEDMTTQIQNAVAAMEAAVKDSLAIKTE